MRYKYCDVCFVNSDNRSALQPAAALKVKFKMSVALSWTVTSRAGTRRAVPTACVTAR